MRAKSHPTHAHAPSTRAALVALVAVVVAGCPSKDRQPSGTTSADATATSDAAASTPRAAHDPKLPRSDRELPTTSASIYFGNLDGQIQAATARLEREPKSAPAELALGSLLYTRGKHRGDYDELARALSHVSRAIELAPDDAPAYLARAQQLQTVHRFDAARRDAERARKLGGSILESKALERELDYVQGRYDAAIKAIRDEAHERRTTQTIARLALLEHDLGQYEAAERHFSEAESLVRDTNPIPVAWLNVQRGIHCEQTGQLERAAEFFREAVRRIPGYVMAEEHLAETLHELGRDDEAIALYEEIVERSSDPEFKGALADLYRAKGRTKEADALAQKATREYEALLVKMPEAMYWHSAEFFMNQGKAHRAAELLKKDVAMRPGAPNLVRLAEAQLAAGNVKEAKSAIDKAIATPLVSAEMFWTAAQIERALGDDEKRALFESKARALNPRIGEDAPAAKGAGAADHRNDAGASGARRVASPDADATPPAR